MLAPGNELSDKLPAPVGATVLLVEDDLAVSDAVAELLSDAGFRVAIAGDGRSALSFLWSNPLPAAMVVDLFMPAMTGWDLCAELRADLDLSRIPVIVMTAAGDHWGYPVPPPMVVRKPIDSNRLLQLLQAVTTRPLVRRRRGAD